MTLSLDGLRALLADTQGLLMFGMFVAGVVVGAVAAFVILALALDD